MVAFIIIISIIGGVGAAIWQQHQNHNKNNIGNVTTYTSNNSQPVQQIYSESMKWYENQQSVYQNPLVKEHFENIEQIEMQYSILYNKKEYFSVEMERLINLCKHDIHIFSSIKEIFQNHDVELPISWPSFKRLAIIYERRKEYNKAIEICEDAISKGFIEDGSKGKMPGRLARLQRLANNTKSS